jgi:YD repeat-containing protein
MRRIATGLVVLGFLAGGVSLASATGWGGWGGWDGWGGSGHIQYKKKKFCALIQWLYDNGTWDGRTQVKTGSGYGWWDLDDLIEFCFDELELKPRASCTASPNPVKKNKTVTFSGAGSRDPDGQVVRWEWDLDGNGSFETVRTSSSVTRSYSSTGEKTVSLRVVDNAGLVSPVSTCKVWVKSY